CSHSTDKGRSHKDNIGPQTGSMDLSGVLWSLQHLDIAQVRTRHVQNLCSKG
ncbi:hypothetical protein GOODEAATRI_034621, partial [Goodea atripinnis]